MRLPVRRKADRLPLTISLVVSESIMISATGVGLFSFYSRPLDLGVAGILHSPVNQGSDSVRSICFP